MPDRKKYIEILSKTAKTVKEFNEDTPIKISLECIEDILELLKEQEVHKFFVDESGKITPLPIVFPNCPLKEYEAVVRCKDCKYGKIHGINVECIAHEEVGYDPEPWHPLDWFCADAERK